MEITAFMKSNELNTVEITITDKGISSNKVVSFDDYIKSLLGAKKDRQSIRVNSLPNTFIDGKLFDDKSGNFVLFIPKSKQRISYVNDKDVQIVPLPSLIFFFTVEEMRIKNSYVFASKLEDAKKYTVDTPLYNYPLGNVRPYSGNICWGRNEINQLSTFRDLDYYIQLFINSPTNDDNFTINSSVGGNQTLVTLLQTISTQDEFDESLLIATGRTTQEFLNNL